jgi:hypothetical protein
MDPVEVLGLFAARCDVYSVMSFVNESDQLDLYERSMAYRRMQVEMLAAQPEVAGVSA